MEKTPELVEKPHSCCAKISSGVLKARRQFFARGLVRAKVLYFPPFFDTKTVLKLSKVCRFILAPHTHVNRAVIQQNYFQQTHLFVCILQSPFCIWLPCFQGYSGRIIWIQSCCISRMTTSHPSVNKWCLSQADSKSHCIWSVGIQHSTATHHQSSAEQALFHRKQQITLNTESNTDRSANSPGAIVIHFEANENYISWAASWELLKCNRLPCGTFMFGWQTGKPPRSAKRTLGQRLARTNVIGTQPMGACHAWQSCSTSIQSEQEQQLGGWPSQA